MTQNYMNNDLDNRQAEREWMVQTQLISRDITDEAVITSMLAVPRHLFVEENQQPFAYYDTDLEIEARQTISQPYMVALMAQALRLKSSDKVLEIGTGSGYSAAILSRIASKIYTIERHDVLACLARERFEKLGCLNIEVGVGDGTLGWPGHELFDAILVTAGGPRIPTPLLDQLVCGGHLVIPVGQKGAQQLLRIEKTQTGELTEEHLGLVRFVPLIGTEGWCNIKTDFN